MEWIYILETTEGVNRIKVGKAVDVETRVRGIQSMSPVQLQLIWTEEQYNVSIRERQLHRRLRDYHVFGEWFNYSVEVAVILVNYGVMLHEYTPTLVKTPINTGVFSKETTTIQFSSVLLGESM